MKLRYKKNGNLSKKCIENFEKITYKIIKDNKRKFPIYEISKDYHNVNSEKGVFVKNRMYDWIYVFTDGNVSTDENYIIVTDCSYYIIISINHNELRIECSIFYLEKEYYEKRENTLKNLVI